MGHRHGHGYLAVRPVRGGRHTVILLKLADELGIGVGAAVDQRPFCAVDDRHHVVAGQGLMRLQRVGQAEHLPPVLPDDLLGAAQQRAEVVLDPVGKRAPQVCLGILALLPPSALGTARGADLKPLRGRIRRHRRAHPPEALHERRHRGRRFEIA